MAQIIEFLTINVAVGDIDAAVGRYKALGFAPHPPNNMPDPPAQITDVSIPMGSVGHVSVIAGTDPDSMVAKWVEKRGEGMYSVAVRTDDLKGLMEEWTKAGVEWVLPEPYEFPPETPCVQYVAEKTIVNWVKPKSMFGMLLEVFELQGDIRPFGEH